MSCRIWCGFVWQCLTQLLWCYTTSRTVFIFALKWNKALQNLFANIKQNNNFFFFCLLCLQEALECIFCWGLHRWQIPPLPALSPCALGGVLAYPSPCHHHPMKVPEPVPHLPVTFCTPGGLRCPGVRIEPKSFGPSERAKGKTCTKCCFVKKGKE